MMYLVDSDWLIDATRGHVQMIDRITRHATDGIATSIICVGELYDGAVGSPDDDALPTVREFLKEFMVLNLTDPIMESFGRLRSSLRRQGQIIPDLDLLIAATALNHDMVLMTNNIVHFERIPGLRIYQL